MDDDVMSVVSGLSSTTMGSGGSDADGVDIETPLLQALDMMASKRSNDRQTGLQKLQTLLRRYLFPADVMAPRQADLEAGLRKAAKQDTDMLQPILTCEQLLCVQLSEMDIHHHFDEWREVAETVLYDYTLDADIRIAAAQLLSNLAVLGQVQTSECHELMEMFEEFFADEETEPALMAACLQAWSLLLARLPLREACSSGRKQAYALYRLMQAEGTSVDTAFAAGEALVLIGDAVYTMDETPMVMMQDVAESFSTLANESNKSKSKKDLKAQRQWFRQLLEGLETGRCPKTSITVDPFHSLDLTDWAQLRVYHAMRSLLQGGMLHHLRDNLAVRALFDLPPPTLKTRRLTVEEKQNLRAERIQGAQARQMDRKAARDGKHEFSGLF